MSDDFRSYDRYKLDSGREHEEREDRSTYRLVVCDAGHRRLVRP